MYTAANRKARINMTLAIIDQMVRGGFTFFSSVFIDSKSQPYHIDLGEGGYASVDTLCFHLPGYACVVRISVNESMSAIWTNKHHKLYMSACVWMESVHDDLAIYDFCESKGWLTEVPTDPYNWSYAKVPAAPWFNQMPDLKHWRCNSASRTRDACQVSIESSQSNGGLAECLDELLTVLANVKPLLSCQAGGKFNEFPALGLTPYYAFKECADEFWSKFNQRYFRTLARSCRSY